MKSALVLALVIAGIAATAAAASPNKPVYTYWGWKEIGYPANAQGFGFITDTLGGNGHAEQARQQRYALITDTLGGTGYAKQAAPQDDTFITDTLAPGGGRSVDLVASGGGFSWTDAGAGAGAGIGALLLLTGTTLLVLRRRGRLAI